MSDDRELRDALEQTQARLKSAEDTLAEIDRRRSLAEQRAAELERQLAAGKEQLAALQARLQLSERGAVEEQLARVQARLETLELRLRQVDQVAPRLPASGVCTRCGASAVVGRAELVAINATANASGTISATVDREPGAAFFKGTVRGPVWAAVCGRCGYMELNADYAANLYDAWSARGT